MANLPPFFADVEFDAADAEAAIEVLRQIRHAVNALGNARSDACRQATGDWSGRFRDEFDGDFVAGQRQLAAVEERLDAMVADVLAGVHQAEVEQAHRLRRRAEFEEAKRLRELHPPDPLSGEWHAPPNGAAGIYRH